MLAVASGNFPDQEKHDTDFRNHVEGVLTADSRRGYRTIAIDYVNDLGYALRG